MEPWGATCKRISWGNLADQDTFEEGMSGEGGQGRIFTFQYQGFFAFSLQGLKDYVKRLGRRHTARLIGILIINYNFFGKDPLERVFAFSTGNQV